MTPSETGAEKTAYTLKFVPDALKEWRGLDGSIKEPLRRALKKRLAQPHVPGAKLHGDLAGCYKIKLRKQGYRLVYMVEDDMRCGSGIGHRPQGRFGGLSRRIDKAA